MSAHKPGSTVLDPAFGSVPRFAIEPFSSLATQELVEPRRLTGLVVALCEVRRVPGRGEVETGSEFKLAVALVEIGSDRISPRDVLIDVVDNVTLYWLTGTGTSAARSYWESGQEQARAAGQAPPQASIPVGFTTFPDEIFAAPRSWVEKAYPNVTYFNEVDKGGHFAAWEEPQLFSEELRAAFRPLR